MNPAKTIWQVYRSAAKSDFLLPVRPLVVLLAAKTPILLPDSPSAVRSAAKTPILLPARPLVVLLAAKTPILLPDSPSTVRSAAKTPILLPDSPSAVRSAAKTPILLPANRPSMSFAEACGVGEGKYHLLSAPGVAFVRESQRNPHENRQAHSRYFAGPTGLISVDTGARTFPWTKPVPLSWTRASPLHLQVQWPQNR